MTTYRAWLLATAVASVTATGAYAADPIRIGVVTPLSGTYAGIGQQVRWGFDLAVKEINAAGGIMGRQVELLYEDEEANPSVAVQKAEKLFQAFHSVVTGKSEEASEDELGKLAVFAGVRDYPVRVKCATLAWHTLKAALAQQEEAVSTE